LSPAQPRYKARRRPDINQPKKKIYMKTIQSNPSRRLQFCRAVDRLRPPVFLPMPLVQSTSRRFAPRPMPESKTKKPLQTPRAKGTDDCKGNKAGGKNPGKNILQRQRRLLHRRKQTSVKQNLCPSPPYWRGPKARFQPGRDRLEFLPK